MTEYRIAGINHLSVETMDINIGKLNGKLWTVIFTIRGDAIRIISARRSRKKRGKII